MCICRRHGNGSRERKLADAISIPAAIYAVAALTVASGLVVAVRMYETHP